MGPGQAPQASTVPVLALQCLQTCMACLSPRPRTGLGQALQPSTMPALPPAPPGPPPPPPSFPGTLQGLLELMDQGKAGSGSTYPAPHPPWAGWVSRLGAGLYKAPYLKRDPLGRPGLSQNLQGSGGPMAQCKSRSGLASPYPTLALAVPRVSGHLPDPAGLAGPSAPGQARAAAATWPTLSTPESSACPAGLLCPQHSSHSTASLASLRSLFTCAPPGRQVHGVVCEAILGHAWPCRSQGQWRTAGGRGSGALVREQESEGLGAPSLGSE